MSKPVSYAVALTRGDRHFLDSLTTETRNVGEGLLREVRRLHPGQLDYKPTSKKYVETPDNFWTVKIQPRVQSLRITVRGREDEFLDIPHPSIRLRPDMGSYSAFTIDRLDQMQEALSILRRAFDLKPHRRTRY